MTAILVVLSLLTLVVGFLESTAATASVGIVAAGCLLAILARINQAADQHRDVMAILQKLQSPTAPAIQP